MFFDSSQYIATDEPSVATRREIGGGDSASMWSGAQTADSKQSQRLRGEANKAYRKKTTHSFYLMVHCSFVNSWV